MLKYWVVYNDFEAYWCYQDEAYRLIKEQGWKLHGISNDEKIAELMLSEIGAL